MKKHEEKYEGLRFECKLCGHTFSLTEKLPGHEEQAKRIPSIVKARIMADMVARVSRGYGFEMTEKGDYGHYIGVENLRIFSSAFEDLDEVEDLSDEYIEAVQSMNEFLRTVKSLHYAVSVIGPDMGYVQDVVERVLLF